MVVFELQLLPSMNQLLLLEDRHNHWRIITPDAIRYVFHSNFENKNIEVWAYNVDTILAEKVETILRRSVLNTDQEIFMMSISL